MSLLAPLAFLAALAPCASSSQSGIGLASTFLTALVPQENGSEKLPSKLTPAEQKKLADLATAWFAAMAKVEETQRGTTQQKDKARSDLRKMQEAFHKEWGPKDEKLMLMAQLGDLRAVFGNAFTYKSESGNGEYREVTPAKEEKAAIYGVVIPKTYKVENPQRTILLISGYDDERKRFVPAKDWFDSTWKGSELGKDTLFVIPKLDQKITTGDHSEAVADLDPEPDLAKENGEKEEEARNTAIMRPMFQAMMRLNLDRDRIFIDAGKGACGYALRLASYFPNRFAGLILRHPVDLGKTRLDSLSGVPVLIVVKKDPESAEHKQATKIAGILNGFQADMCKVLEVAGEYPFNQSAKEIGDWAAASPKRDLYRKKVVLVPNHHNPRFQNAYWVRILQSEMLGQVADKDRPSVIAEADRATNRITVTTTGVSKLMLFLNDALVDLSKDVTIVVNGNAETRKVTRDLNFLTQSIKNNLDPGFLWVARHEASVKK